MKMGVTRGLVPKDGRLAKPERQWGGSCKGCNSPIATEHPQFKDIKFILQTRTDVVTAMGECVHDSDQALTPTCCE